MTTKQTKRPLVYSLEDPTKLPSLKKRAIATHSWTFHADEVVACYLLQKLPDYEDSTIIRSRNATILDGCDVVVDVGGTFDPSKSRFDHHQKGFNEFWTDKRTITKLSSAGLVWKYLGKRILKEGFDVTTPEKVDFLHDMLYRLVFESIDANDNGVQTNGGLEPMYTGGLPSLGGEISKLNTSWIEEGRRMDQTECFIDAFMTVATKFDSLLRYYVDTLFDAHQEISKAAATTSDPRIIRLKKYPGFKVLVKLVCEDARFLVYPIEEGLFELKTLKDDVLPIIETVRVSTPTRRIGSSEEEVLAGI